MRILVTIPAFLLVSLALSACSTSSTEGVLPRDPVPLPPTIGGSAPRAGAVTTAPAPTGRRTLSVPSRS